jgi:hypothetical protein
MGVKEVSARWIKASRALKKGDQVYALKLAEMARRHCSEAFCAWRILGGGGVLRASGTDERIV